MDNGLILSLYNDPSDAQPTDSAHNEGGALILHAHLELLFWGTAWQTATDPSITDVIDAVKGILASPYLLGLAEYGFQDAEVRGTTVIATDPPQNYSSSDAPNLVLRLIDDGQFPDPDDDGGRILYMVFMPSGTNPPQIEGTPYTEFGAHSDPEDSDSLGLDKDYAWVGWISHRSLDGITKTFSHELVEAITDPEGQDRAWVMNRKINGGVEIGDACNHAVDLVDGITVQAYWSERHKACVIPKGRGPLPSLRSLEQAVRVQSGSAGSAVVSLDRRTPIDVTVSLSSDNPEVLRVPATMVIPTGSMDGSMMLFAEPKTGPYQFVAVHASWGGTTVSTQVEVTPRPSIISGVVRDTASHPIAQAILLIDHAGTGFQMETGSDGSYATGTLPPGTYTVSVSASGFVPAEATVVVQEGVPATDTDFTLEARLAFTIAGTVTNSQRTPVVGARVLLMQQSWYERLDSVTDSAGGYSLSMDPMDYTGRYWLRVTAPGYADGFLDLAIPNGASLREDFVLLELGVVTGTVVTGGTSQAPITGADVKATISTDDPLAQSSFSAVSDSGGRYLLQLPPGSTAVTVRAHGFEAYATTVAAVPGGTVDRDFVLTEASASLSCTVSDVDSRDSINGAHVQAGGELGEIRSDGRYHVSNIPAGMQEVGIRAHGYQPQQDSFDFTAGQTIAVDFYLDPLVSPAFSPVHVT